MFDHKSVCLECGKFVSAKLGCVECNGGCENASSNLDKAFERKTVCLECGQFMSVKSGCADCGAFADTQTAHRSKRNLTQPCTQGGAARPPAFQLDKGLLSLRLWLATEVKLSDEEVEEYVEACDNKGVNSILLLSRISVAEMVTSFGIKTSDAVCIKKAFTKMQQPHFQKNPVVQEEQAQQDAQEKHPEQCCDMYKEYTEGKLTVAVGCGHEGESIGQDKLETKVEEHLQDTEMQEHLDRLKQAEDKGMFNEMLVVMLSHFTQLLWFAQLSNLCTSSCSGKKSQRNRASFEAAGIFREEESRKGRH